MMFHAMMCSTCGIRMSMLLREIDHIAVGETTLVLSCLGCAAESRVLEPIAEPRLLAG